MVKNNLLLAIRQLKSNKVFSLINVLGLSLSMVACLLIFKYISFEKSYDAYHRDTDELYRLYRQADYGDMTSKMASIFPGITPEIKANVPEVQSAARFIGSDKVFQSFAFTYFHPNGSNNTFNINRGFFADHDALDIFKLTWKEGEGVASLQNPEEMIISASIAQKYFGNEPALGKTLHFKNMERDLKVTGVFEDVPENTHFKFDVLVSFKFLPEEWELNNDFGWGNFYTYVRLTEGADVPTVEAKINTLLRDRESWYAEEGIEFKFQLMKDIHLTSNLGFELEANGNEQTVYFLSIIGVFIMIIAWVNYINLSTSKLVDRGKEVGIRKVLGGFRIQLVYQFLTESLLINFLAIAVSITILQLSLDFFQGLLGIPLSFISGKSLYTTLTFIGVFSLGSIVFGFYPAVLFSRLKVAQVLKGRSKVNRSGLMLRRGLSILQFAIALVLIIGTLAVYQQLNFLQNKSLGMNIEQTLIVRKPFMDSANRWSSHEAFLNGMSGLSAVNGISASSEIPGQLITRQRSVKLDATDNSHGVYAKDICVDEHFFDLYQIEVLFGRNFTPEDNGRKIILNESAAKELFGNDDLESKINQTYYYLGQPAQLVGIIGDYNQESLKTVSQPHIYAYTDRVRYYSVKVNTQNIARTLDEIGQVFNDSYSASHFDYFFLDSFFDRQYRADRLFGRIFAFFSVLAIVVTVLGLFGLSLYNVTQRAKEVSIRKVLGASLKSLSVLLSKEYLYLVLLGALISIPLGYLLVDQWLSNFPYRMSIGWMIFLLPVVLVAMLTVITVGYQVLKAALANPAETLRWE